MASALGSRPDFEAVSAADVPLHEHLQIICASRAFENSATLKNLLIYLFQSRNQVVSEYTVAVEALDRKPNFDPQIDATVRVQISRLRRRLKDYYLSEGRTSSIRFIIPLGTHQLVPDHVANGNVIDASQSHSSHSHALAPIFPDVISQLPVSHPPPQTASATSRRFPLTIFLATLVILLAATCAWQYLQIRSLTRAAQPAIAPQLSPLWKNFTSNGKTVRLVIPNPTFFNWTSPGHMNLMMRDTNVNDFADINKSPQLSAMVKQFGTPQLTEYYTVSSDVIASLKLTQFMSSRNFNNVSTTISSNTAAEFFEGENVILFGTPGTMSAYKNLMSHLYFQFDPQAQHLINPAPANGQPREWDKINQSPSRAIFPGLIAFLPGNAKGSHLLILAGSETDGLVSFLTSDSGNRAIQDARRRAGNADFFEAAILSEAEGSTVLSNRLVAFHAVTPQD
jgi:hypothetical protein